MDFGVLDGRDRQPAPENYWRIFPAKRKLNKVADYRDVGASKNLPVCKYLTGLYSPEF